jgi:hypothetical protein
MFKTEHGIVKLDASCRQAKCDGSSVPKPRDTALGSRFAKFFPLETIPHHIFLIDG